MIQQIALNYLIIFIENICISIIIGVFFEKMYFSILGIIDLIIGELIAAFIFMGILQLFKLIIGKIFTINNYLYIDVAFYILLAVYGFWMLLIVNPR